MKVRVKYNICLLILFLAFGVSNCYGQNKKYVDSILAHINSNISDKEKGSAYSELAYIYRKQDNYKALEYGKLCLELALKIKDPKIEWSALNSIAESYRLTGDFNSAVLWHQKALDLAVAQKLSIKEGNSCNNMALVYKDSNRQDKAKEYYDRSLKAYQKADYVEGFYSIYNNLGNLYMQSSSYDTSLMFFRKGFQIASQLKDSTAIAQIYNNMGNTYFYKELKDSAFIYYGKSFELRKKFSAKSEIANSGINLAYMYAERKDFKKAKSLYLEMTELARQAGDFIQLGEAYKYLSELFFELGEYKNAYVYQDSSQKNYRSRMDAEKIKSLSDASAKYETEKKELLISQLNIENTAKEAILEQVKKTRIVMGVILFLAIVFSIYLFYTVKQRDKTNKIISQQKQEVEFQKELVEVHQKEILDSINYAKHLQQAILPPQSFITENLPESFVLYLPKDIVAGDFYWVERMGDLVWVASADCTGHGVPGAMVSVVCSNALNRSVKEFRINDPGKVLDKVRELVIETFEKSEAEVKDGMDISLCALNVKSNELKWAGANNPLWLVKQGREEITEIKADKQPIGISYHPKPFTTQVVQLVKGDSIYIFTDGYADQFGGEGGKKFKYKQLKEVILTNYKKPLPEQKSSLNTAFAIWKASLEQVDDVCIIGIRV